MQLLHAKVFAKLLRNRFASQPTLQAATLRACKLVQKLSLIQKLCCPFGSVS
jgi:hypothetical protein